MDTGVELSIDNSYRAICSTCLSGDRNLFSLNEMPQLYQAFRLLMYDFAGDRFGESLDMEVLVCWECLALLKRFVRFKQQVHSAQEHLRVLALSRAQETLDHTYMSQSLSSLEVMSKSEYDKIYFDYGAPDNEWSSEYISIHPSHSVKLDIDDGHLLEVPEIVLENPVTGVMSHIVVNSGAFVAQSETFTPATVKGELPESTSSTASPQQELVIINTKSNKGGRESKDAKSGYFKEFMSEADMLAVREAAKQKVQYATSVYKCELCIIGFYTQQQVEDHFNSSHRAKPGVEACKVCYVYVEDSQMQSHLESHYCRYTCRYCGHNEYSERLATVHQSHHTRRKLTSGGTQIRFGDIPHSNRGRKKKEKPSPPPKPGDLRKLLSKTTIEGYQCLECDMFFKNSRARKNHVARFHREGLQCDHCKKRFVNRTTLATHIRLHEGPLPRQECPICNKMVRVTHLKYHIQRHQNKEHHKCIECNKVFSHLATYHAHLKYSRAHASEQVFKYPCPMCNKGYPTKEQMQDHFNYQHLGKTSHKCPVCDKPIASRANVEKHMMRVHCAKKEKPRNHRCEVCGKAFTDKKALTQHEVIHSCDRPLQCDICQQTFKQKASLYTHRKRVHKVYPAKRVVEFMDSKPGAEANH